MGESSYASAMWWTEQFDDTRHEAVFRVLSSIEDRQDYMARAHLSHARLYDNSPLIGLTPYAYTRTDPMDSEYLSLNIVKNIIDARTSRICRSRPKAAFLSSNGNWFMQRRAKKLEAFADAQFYENKLYEQDTQLVTDVGIFGTAPLKVYADQKRKKLVGERVHCHELVVDDVEAQYGEPRSMYQRKYVDRAVVIEEYASGDSPDAIELRARIKDAKTDERRDSVWNQSSADLILVVEAWHLRSGPDADDGRHCVVLNNCTLVDEEYKRDRFPFSLMREKRPRTGIWGDSLCNLLAGLQFEVNSLLEEISQGHHMVTGHYLVEEGSGVNVAHLNNDLRSIVTFNGTAPQYIVPQIIAPEVYQHLWQLVQQMYTLAGMNQEAASGQSPTQYRSGEAVERADDINTTRQLALGRSREEFYLDVVEQFLELAPTIPNYEAKAQAKRFYTAIKWSDVDMKRDDYVLKIYPASELPQSIGGRMDTIKDMIDLQVLSGPSEVRKLMNMPDLDQSDSLALADLEYVDWCVDKILDAEDPNADGVYKKPHAFIGDLPAAADRARRHLLNAETDGCPEANLEVLREWIGDVKQLAAPPPAPANTNAIAPGVAPAASLPAVPPLAAGGAKS